jgi:prevent-host-death family protein
MITVGLNTLRKNLSAVLKKVENGESISITSRGHEIALLVPPESKMEKARKALEELRKTAFVGDVIAPVTDEWELL